ncbi:phosphatidylethanolamine-binding protein [Bisporella sp. PMI_857]|nr:phosphatidylethanolamine-binding protein [Bisporella sp. PMI_857]
MSALAEHAKALSASLEQAKLVPGPAADLITPDFKPTVKVGISFDGKKTVDLGNFFRAGECKLPPTITITDAADDVASNASYTLILTDPDAPTPDDPKFAFWRHWVLAGLQPLSDGLTVAQTKPVLTEYLGPGPKDDSKPHRYLFLLFREPAGLDLAKEDLGGEEFVQRRSFKPTEFAEKHGLRLAGVNWMTCAGDGWTE